MALKQDRKNIKTHYVIEDQFNEQMGKFTHTDYFVKHRLLQQGSPNEM